MPCAKPAFPRCFEFDLPLFPERDIWRHTADDYQPPEIVKRQCQVTHEALRRVTKKDIPKLFVNYNSFAFPIYEVRREAGQLVTTSVGIQPYASEPFQPAWASRERTGVKAWTAHNVPVPKERFSPGGPSGEKSDGNVILYDRETKTEYDFWQVSTINKGETKISGGGVAGDKMVRTGSLAAFDVKGPGVRDPHVDPHNSSRASGLPYLGGLIIPEDLIAGNFEIIPHILALAIPELRYQEGRPADSRPNWVFPATNTETTKPSADEFALAAGQRISLKENIHRPDGTTVSITALLHDTSIPLIVRIFLSTLYNRGAYVVDGSEAFNVVAEDILTANPSWDDAKTQELVGPDVKLTDKMTAWELIMHTLNSWLSEKLFKGAGLAFAYQDDANGFRCNFEVVKDECPFYTIHQ